MIAALSLGMALLAFAAALAAGGLVFALFRYAQAAAARAEAAWQSVAHARGLVYVPPGWGEREIHGRIGAIAVTLRTETTTVSTGQTTITTVTHVATASPPKPPAVGLAAAGVMAQLAVALGGEDHRTGDEAFDDAVRVRGDAADCLAMLDVDTRAALMLDLDAGVWIAEGKVNSRADAADDATRIGDQIDRVCALASRLHLADRDARLAHNALHDPLLTVRLANARALWHVAGGTERAARVRDAFATSDHSALVVAAALAGAIVDPSAMRGHALAVLDADDPETVTEALGVLARAGLPEDVAAIRGVGRSHRRLDLEVPIAAIQARVGDAAQGGLSVAEPGSEGGLSRPTARGGELSKE